MATYRVKRNGKEYVYNYPRSNFQNNTEEYNREYYNKNKEAIAKRKKVRNLEERLSEVDEA